MMKLMKLYMNMKKNYKKWNKKKILKDKKSMKYIKVKKFKPHQKKMKKKKIKIKIKFKNNNKNKIYKK